ncbi:MAG: NYN domain-containing protein [Nostoc sp. DedVER02]|uniref:NYN domain-containing protein n=1 Tax=unclassified Nostoc TaxID=2593658 RepID=UPI002AD33D27|nr:MULTISPECIES: NYN domain-containing protein [unclassified Nostoc]MDZ7987588.1 NYN domain-containing protein [Nostoc sp. DedVER02]MDZ8112964.1 NYN domain-containing protein [Nostoc sp. DedVER01b]
MPNEAANQEQSFLIDLLRATYQNQEVYPILQHNLSKLNDNLALMLRKWVSDRFAKEPANASNIVGVIVKLSRIIQGFEQGNPASNLEIAIAGYESVLQVCTREAFPKEWDIVQQALITAYQQRQQIFSRTIGELREHTVQTQSQIYTLTEQLQHESEQAKLQVNELKTIITQLKQEVSNSEQTQEITSLIVDLKELKQRHIGVERFTTTAHIEQFNTAIFYDIENLTMGRSNPNLNFSLKQIQTNLESTSLVNKIAIQCAYADWSDSRLKLLKNEIQELGIEAIQIFDYSYKRNAADMQLAIDVMELAQTRPTLQVFVIISGDGAFAALAKKLHEYGKTVIGCAYEGQINRVLKSVCDRFIPIPAPQAKIEEIPINEVKNQSSLNDDILVETKKVLQGLKQNVEQLNQLKQVGIPISQIHKILREKISAFDHKREQHGEKLTIFLNKVIEETDIYLSIENNKLFLREILTIGSNGSSNKVVKALSESSNNFKEIVIAGKS